MISIYNKHMNLLLKLFFLVGFMLLSPIIILFMILIVIEDGLPALFIQKRDGKNMKIIKIFKIRTMQNATPNLGTHEVNLSNYLKVGSLIRKLKIDELPQIINYLRGDLSIVGPRPCLPNQSHLVSLRKEKEIFHVRPGITGLAQILGYDMSDPSLLTKVDSLYIKSKSFKLDTLIFFGTFIKSLRPYIEKKFKKQLSEGK